MTRRLYFLAARNQFRFSILGFGIAFLLGLSLLYAPQLRKSVKANAPFTTIVVNTTADDAVNNGNCTLREAIMAANTNAAVDACPAGVAGLDTIQFDIGIGTPTINVTSALPATTESVLINGATGGATRVELNGSGAGASVVGLSVGGSNSTIRSLVINRFSASGIQLGGTGGHAVENCYIGTNAAGTAALGNGVDGVRINGTSNNRIGGLNAAMRNVISGNQAFGVLIFNAGATGNLVQGNYIGLNAAGTQAVGNAQDGVRISSASNNVVGGTSAGARNYISGNLDGVFLLGTTATGNLVQGNSIGLTVNATSLPNTRDGVQIDGASNNLIGGQAGNEIAFSGRAGVLVTTSFGPGTGNAIQGNSIHDNQGLGIDLAPNVQSNTGVTANDAGDGDTGPNNLQNFPVLSAAGGGGGGGTSVQGTLNSTPSTAFRIEFFSNPVCDGSGNGEGQVFLGFANVTTDASGDATINANLAASVASGQVVTATATDAANNTSEFSPCVSVFCGTITILPAALPNGATGAPYNQTFTNTGGAGSVLWSISAGTLPPGLTLSPGGVLSGTPSAAGSFNFTVKATDSNGCMGTHAYTLVITCAAIATSNQSFTASGGNGTVNVIGPGSCAWTAVSNAPWIGVTGGASGSGNGTVSYSVAANGGTAPRAGTITIAGNTFIVSQAATGVLVYTDFEGGIPLDWTVIHNGTGVYPDGTPATWTAANPCGRVIPAPFSGQFAIVDALCAGPGVTFNEQLITPTFNATGVGTVYVEFFNRFLGTGAPGNIGDLDASIDGGTSWPSNVQRFQNVDEGLQMPTTRSFNISPAIGANPANARVRLHYTGNGTGLPRLSRPDFQEVSWGIDFAIYYYTLNPTSQNFSASGGTGNISVSTSAIVPSPQGAWTATSNAPWITPAAMGGTGNGALGYMVSANPTTSPRTGTMTIAGNTFTVMQGGCTPSTISPASVPNGFVGTAYNQALMASGGVSPYTFSIGAGTLPNGLNLSTGGVLSGTPTTTGTFSFTVKATDAIGCMGTQTYTVIISGSGLMFYPLPHPIRLFDTRAPIAGFPACAYLSQPLQGNVEFVRQARITCDGITIPDTAKAIVGNATVVNPQGGGFAILFPNGQPRPTASNINFAAGQVIANSFTVGLGDDGQFRVYPFVTTDFVVDITGYFAPPGAGGLYYHALPRPIRLFDTRAPIPGFPACAYLSQPLQGNVEFVRQARITCDGITIPNDAQVIVGNSTVVNPAGGGFATLFPNGQPRPNASNINYAAGQVIANAFTVGLGSDGQFRIYPFTTTDFVVDIAGYYSPSVTDANGTGLLYDPLPHPIRLFDTRSPIPGFPACAYLSQPLQGNVEFVRQAQITCDGITIPATAVAITGNSTVVNPVGGGFATLFPNGQPRPNASNINYAAGQVIANAFTLRLGGDGQFRVYPFTATDFVLDITGYFKP